MNVQYNPGISLAESNRLGIIAEKLVMEVPEVKTVGRRTGRAELDEHAEGVHNSEIDVDLAKSKRSPRIFSPISATGCPCCQRPSPSASRSRTVSTTCCRGVRAQIAIKVFGDDVDTLRTLANLLRTRLQSVPGMVDLQVEKQVLIPQLRITPDYERAALYGITPAALIEALEGLSNGRVVSQIVEGNKRFDVLMRLSDDNRSTTGLDALLISTPQGFVPLRTLARVEEGDGPNQILRENGQRRIVVSANGDGKRDMAAIIADVRRIVGETQLPRGYITQLEARSRRRRMPHLSSASCRWCRSR